jgi:hypothetical protein
MKQPFASSAKLGVMGTFPSQVLPVLLARAGVVETAEFAALLSTFAATVEETDPGEGRLLASWASCVASTTTN